MIRWIFAATASVALVAVGVVHGFWTDRWGISADTTTAADRLADIPMSFGDWKGEEVEVKPGQVGAGVAGCLQRRYLNQVTGQTVTIALVNGRPGPVATHTPEVCYGASGYMVGEKKDVQLDSPDSSAHFWTSVAVRTKSTDETRIRLYWAWNGGNGWHAASDARAEFPRFRHSVLHKLYVLRDLSHLPSASKPGEMFGPAPKTPVQENRDEVCEAFLNAFVPVLDRTLFRNNPG